MEADRRGDYHRLDVRSKHLVVVLGSSHFGIKTLYMI